MSLPTTFDEFTLRTLIVLGSSTTEEREGIANELKLKSAFLRSCSPDVSFEVAHDLAWEEVSDMIKGLTLAENFGVSNHRGSVSLVKYAFRVVQRRDPIEAMALAAWIVDNSDNPYIPFEMRKIRHAFERTKDKARSWKECREQLDQWESNERERQSRLAGEAEQRRKFSQEEKRPIIEAIRSRCNAEIRNVQLAKSSARMQLLEQLATLSPKQRLEHIAWDDCHPIGYFPFEFYEVATGTLQALAFPTRERLKAQPESD
jgi:hypothetical protein